jgi:hypothetical protein
MFSYSEFIHQLELIKGGARMKHVCNHFSGGFTETKDGFDASNHGLTQESPAVPREYTHFFDFFPWDASRTGGAHYGGVV